jgi:PAS domain S-box-containing protein
MIYHHGPGFWAAVAFYYSMAILAIYFLARAALRTGGPYRRQMIWLILSVIAPMVGSILYLLGPAPLAGLDTTPISFSFAGLFLTWNIFSYQLFDLMPVARDALIENMTDGVVVLDAQNRIVDINTAARRFLWPTPESPIGRPARAVIETWPDLLARYRDVTEAQAEIRVGKDTPRDLDLRITPLYDRKKHLTGRMIVLRNITERKRAELALQELNADLERQVKERTAQLDATVRGLESEVVKLWYEAAAGPGLQATIHDLEKEITERRRVEEVLRQTEESLAQRVADQSRKLTAMYEVILMGGQSLEMRELLEQSLDRIITVMIGDAACIHLWDEGGEILRLNAQRGLSAEAQAQIEILPEVWLQGDSIPWSVNDLTADAEIPRSIRLPGFGAYLGAPINLRERAVGALSVFWSQPVQFPVEDIAMFSAMADQLGIIIENVRLRRRSEQAAAMQERRRLARDLHDSVTQSLHSLVLSADTASNRFKKGNLDRLEESLSQLADSARQALKEMRLLLYELRLIPLEQVNLVEALQTRLETVERRAGVEAQFLMEGKMDWPPAWEGELYCIAMEALNNSLKHARATQVSVRLNGGLNRVELEIVDNGQGFEFQDKFDQYPRAGGMGLRSMAERAERLGGKLVIDSQPGMGTRVRVSVESPENL